MSDHRHDPLSGPAPVSVHLPHAPLVRVMGQLVFNPITKIGEPELKFVSGFQEKIRGTYPIIQQKDGQAFDFTTEGNQVTFQSTRSAVWLFSDREENYRVTLTTDKLTLESAPNCYQGRKEFLTYFNELSAAFVEEFPDVTATRVGYRYISQCTNESIVGDLSTYINDELIGIVAASADWRQNIQNTISRVSAKTDEGFASWQWGLIPVGHTHDPLVMPPFDVKSWVLDIDSTGDIEFSDKLKPAVVMEKLGEAAERSYAIFRWCVKDEFLKHYGGKL